MVFQYFYFFKKVVLTVQVSFLSLGDAELRFKAKTLWMIKKTCFTNL